MHASQTSRPFLAIGVVSAPEYLHRRTVLRSTWLKLEPTPEAPVATTFVIRAANAPKRLLQLLQTEERLHGDVLRVQSVAWNETRLRGPVLTLSAWLRHAATHLAGARFVAKVDDDSYLHAPDLAAMLRPLAASLPHPMAYMGTLTWYSWFADQWDRCGFGWTWRGSENVGHLCRNSSWAGQRCQPRGCGASVGPFPFAAGYLVVLSAPLVSAIVHSPRLEDETRRLRDASQLVTHRGFRHTQIFEDVWLGSFVHRFVSSEPIAWVQLFRSETVVDLDHTQWGSTVRPSALLVHIRSKESRIFVATHDFLLSASVQGCRRRAMTMNCSAGCDAFGVPTSASSAVLCAPRASSAGAASSSSYCRLTMAPPDPSAATAASLSGAAGRRLGLAPPASRKERLCAPVNLQPAVRSPGVRARAKAIDKEARRCERIVASAGSGPARPDAGRALRQIGGAGGAGGSGGGNAGGGGSGGGGGRAWRAGNNLLQAWLHVAQLRDDGTLDIPDGMQIVIEIGANTRNTLDRELLPLAPSAFLISFEPLLDKYASLISRNSRPDTRAPLGHHHPRGIVLPFAVSSMANRIREFKISGRTDGCASLLDPVSSYYSTDCTNTSGILERRAVPSVSLEAVLGGWLRGRNISLAKVDAQGLDVGVVRSAGAHIDRLKAVQLEVVRDRPPLKCEPQYASEPGRPSEAKCGAVVAAMAKLGYSPYATNCEVHKFKEAGGCEAEMMFVRPGFDVALTRTFCRSQRPPSCGPGAWSLPADRKGWTVEMRAWAEEAAKGWPAVDVVGGKARHGGGRAAMRAGKGRG